MHVSQGSGEARPSTLPSPRRGGVNLRVVFFGFVGVMCFVHVPLLFAVTGVTLPGIGGPAHGPGASHPGDVMPPHDGGDAGQSAQHRFLHAHRIFTPVDGEREGDHDHAVDGDRKRDHGLAGGAAVSTPSPPTPAPFDNDGLDPFSPRDDSGLPDAVAATMETSAGHQSAAVAPLYGPRSAFTVEAIGGRDPVEGAAGDDTEQQKVKFSILVSVTSPEDAIAVLDTLRDQARSGSEKRAEVVLAVPSAMLTVAASGRGDGDDAADGEESPATADPDPAQPEGAEATRTLPPAVAKKAAAFGAVVILACTASGDALATAVPAPWDLISDAAGVITTQTIVVFGPGVTARAGSLLGVADSMAKAVWELSVGGVGAPVLAGCAALTYAESPTPGRARRVDDALETLSAGLKIAEGDAGIAFIMEGFSGYPASVLGDQVQGERSSTRETVVAPSPMCFAVQRDAVKAAWETATGGPDERSNKGQNRFGDAKHPAVAGLQRFVNFASEHESSRDGRAQHSNLAAAPLYHDFIRFALTVSSGVLAESAGQAPKGTDRVPPLPIVGQAVFERLSPAVLATVVARQKVYDLLAPMQATANADITTFANRIMPPLTTPEDADAPDIVTAAPGIVWDTFCIKCFGFSNEVMHFAVPLLGRIDIRLTNAPDCFCPGTPTSFETSLELLAKSKEFEKAFRDRRGKVDAKARNPLIWIAHKDPGSFPVNSFPGLGRRPDIVVGRGMYEFNKVPSNWDGKDKVVDELWVPSRYVRWVFEQAGFSKDKLYVMPEPIDTRQFDPTAVAPFKLPVRHLGWKLGSNREGNVVTDVVDADEGLPLVPQAVRELRGNFKYLSIFKWESRKAWDVLLRAYFRAFLRRHDGAADRVSLYLVSYVYGDNGRSPTRMLRDAERVATEVLDELRIEQHTLPGDAANNNKHSAAGGGSSSTPAKPLAERTFLDGVPHIEIISEQLGEADLIRLYRSVDAFVIPTRGEGWGLPIIQAMAMGLPTIATNWSGNVDFMTPETTYPIRVDELNELPDGCEYGAAPGKVWAEPSISHLEDLLTHVYDNPVEAAAKGRLARAHVERHYSDDAIAQLVVKRSVQLAEKWHEREADAANREHRKHSAKDGRGTQRRKGDADSDSSVLSWARSSGGGAKQKEPMKRTGADLLLEGQDKSLIP